MPYTKRIVHYGTADNLLNYILDEKHLGEKVYKASGFNCNVETALLEFKDTYKKYNPRGDRIAYHIIQSFSPNDPITPEDAHNIAKKLCERLYPNYQCVVSTHIDKGHIHNHIAVNAINLLGKKLEDRLANSKEGLYGISNISDEISKEYGCYIMPKRKISIIKNRDYYNEYKIATNKVKIKESLEVAKAKSSNLDEFIDELVIMGLEIKRGKHLAAKTFNMKKYTRIDTIDKEFSVENLNRFFMNKNNIFILPDISVSENDFNIDLLNKSKEAKLAIEKTSEEGKIYNDFQKKRYMDINRFYKLKEQLEYLEKYSIHSFTDLENAIEEKNKELKYKNTELKKYRKEVEIIIEISEKAQDYIKLKKTYDYANFYKSIDPEYVFPQEANIFLKIQEELNISSIEEAKKMIKSSRTERIKVNKMKNEVFELQREKNKLELIKEEQLKKSELHIDYIRFSAKHINYNESSNKKFCIKLPYLNDKRIYALKKHITYNEKLKLYTLFLIDDKRYELIDSKGNKETMIGSELKNCIETKKNELSIIYSK